MRGHSSISGKGRGWLLPVMLGVSMAFGALVGISAGSAYGIALMAVLAVPFVFAMLPRPTYEWVVVALGVMVFSRTFAAVGMPSALNFAHFPLVGLAAVRAAALGRASRAPSGKVLAGMLGFLVISALSGAVNGTAAANPFLLWILFLEPFLLLYAIVRDPPPPERRRLFTRVLVACFVVQIPFALWQTALFGIGDAVRGTFLGQGAGAHVLGAMLAVGAVFIRVTPVVRSPMLERTLIVAAVAINVLADAKQVIGIFLVSMALLTLLNSPRHWPRYVVGLVALAGFLAVARNYHPRLSQLTEKDLYVLGLSRKASVFPLILGHADSPADWVLGLGPGMTVSRLALLADEEYRLGSSPLEALGLQSSPVTAQVIAENFGAYYSRASSAWSLISSWVGIWGDLGVLGLALYIYLGMLIWRAGHRLRAPPRNAIRLTILFVALLGFVYSYLEEPALMLYAAAWIGFCLTQPSPAHVHDAPDGKAAPADPVVAGGGP